MSAVATSYGVEALRSSCASGGPAVSRHPDQRTQRSRRREVVAATPQDVGRSGALAERADDGRLADAGLSIDERNSPAPVARDRRQKLRERGQLRGTFAQLDPLAAEADGHQHDRKPVAPPGVEQRSDWKVVKGLVGFEGLSGGGRMRGVLEPDPPGGGRETFTGTVTR